jgi:hypothetical protein
LTSRAEHVGEGRQNAEFCHDSMHLGLGRDAQGDELGTLCRVRDYAELLR